MSKTKADIRRFGINTQGPRLAGCTPGAVLSFEKRLRWESRTYCWFVGGAIFCVW
jgi:hypothetical protein